MKDFAAFDATHLADLVRKKEVKPIELVEAAIASIEAVNPRLNAVVTKMYDEARKVASGPLPEGPFTGVPFLLKDLIAAYAGVRMTFGSRATAEFVPPFDSELVRRFKRAGLIICGKTNTPELGIVPTTEPQLFGATKNPWDPTRSTGGSSGGSAAAVAAGIVPMAHANDGGGSIRIPASCCGVFGLKPTRARVPLGPMISEILDGCVAEHAVTRSVRDSAALLDAVHGPDAGDPYAAPAPVRPYSEDVKRDPKKLKIAMTTRAATGVAVHPECVEAVHSTAKLLESLGHEVVEAEPVLDGSEITQAFITVWSSGVAVDLEHFALLRGGAPVEQQDVEPLTWALAETGRIIPATTYVLSVERLQAASRSIGIFLKDYDAWLTPTLAEPPLLLGTLDAQPDNPLYPLMRSAEWVPFTPMANFSGLPAMSVPLAWSKDGLPLGSHFFGRFGDEGTLFALAAQLERARPWADRRPQVRV